jgi:hypothetical protein
MEKENIEKLDALEMVVGTTDLIWTPEHEEYPEGTFWVYSQGMMDNHNMPDLEIRGVTGMFMRAASQTINEINAYRIVNDAPVLAGQSIDWAFGVILVEQGDDWDGRVSWKSEEMLRLTSKYTDVPSCHACDCEENGVTE